MNRCCHIFVKKARLQSTLQLWQQRVRMADGQVSCLSASQLLALQNFLQSNREPAPDYLTCVSDFVSTHRHKTVALKSPAGARWKVGDVYDTMYSDEDDEVNGWGKFFLPEIVSMQVIGVVEGTSCPCDQLVLMTSEDRKLYAYDGEELHLVASSLEQLGEKGMEYPASKTYYNGEAFKNMTEEDWAKVRKGAVGKRLEQEHQKLVLAKKAEFLKNLKATGAHC